MDKKGAANEQIISVLVFVFILIIFSTGMYLYVQKQKDGAGAWEDYYAKEISKTINSMKNGDEFVMDVHRATIVAGKNGFNVDKIFLFDGENGEICVKLGIGRKSCFYVFNKINVKFEMEYGVPGNILHIKADKIIGEVR